MAGGWENALRVMGEFDRSGFSAEARMESEIRERWWREFCQWAREQLERKEENR